MSYDTDVLFSADNESDSTQFLWKFFDREKELLIL